MLVCNESRSLSLKHILVRVIGLLFHFFLWTMLTLINKIVEISFNFSLTVNILQTPKSSSQQSQLKTETLAIPTKLHLVPCLVHSTIHNIQYYNLHHRSLQ